MQLWQNSHMDQLQIDNQTAIPLSEIELIAIRSQGAGGQHVNKVATGIHLRFDIHNSSLPEQIKERLLQLTDRRINKDGVITIKSQQARSQLQNRLNALELLQRLIKATLIIRKPRKRTGPTRSSKQKRLKKKNRRGQVKNLRQKITT